MGSLRELSGIYGQNNKKSLKLSLEGFQYILDSKIYLRIFLSVSSSFAFVQIDFSHSDRLRSDL
ncbi:hypothetical protein LV84_00741 [Algoriphagus ratkowskyi]|uniref:Uncharacterized protein n=1 Tax=Algoriphagus ratkowskyi TaxID=57028 RepID=A0A2W7TB83_9BACT|nr:hypothetical protein LV84_00741 [Algoriphagus ratkowskyi]